MNQRDEASLLKDWSQGDGEAFGDLFEIHSNRLFSLAYRLTSSLDDSRDLLQETAFKAFATGARCHQPAAFYGWIRRILMNVYLDSLRYRTRAGRNQVDTHADWSEIEERFPANESDDPRSLLERQERIVEVEQALQSLDPVYRTVLVLREIEGLSYLEIANELAVPIETVRTRLRRARDRMREALRPLEHVV